MDKYLEKLLSGLPKTGQFLWFLGKHAFGIFLILISICCIYGAFIFYQYAYLAQTEEPKVDAVFFQFNDSSYQQILGEWQARDQKRQNVSTEEYVSPF